MYMDAIAVSKQSDTIFPFSGWGKDTKNQHFFWAK